MEDLKLKNKIDAYIDAIKRIMSVFFCDRVPAVTDGKRSKKRQPLSSKTLKDMGARDCPSRCGWECGLSLPAGKKPRKNPFSTQLIWNTVI